MNQSLNDLYVALLTIVITLNGIGIPLSFNIVSSSFKEYLDKNMYKILLAEPEFKSNLIVSFYALIIFSIPLIFDLSTLLGGPKQYGYVARNGYVMLAIFTIAGFLISFVNFSLLMYRYASNSTEIIFQKTKAELDEQLK